MKSKKRQKQQGQERSSNKVDRLLALRLLKRHSFKATLTLICSSILASSAVTGLYSIAIPNVKVEIGILVFTFGLSFVLLAVIFLFTYLFTFWHLQRKELASKNHENVATVPVWCEFMLYLFLSREEQIYLIGDLVEEYGVIHTKFGKTKANIWFYKQVVGSVWPLVRKAIIKWGLLVWLGRWISRFIS